MKGLFSILAFLFFAFSANAQCSPDSSLNSTGTRPDVLASATVGVPYSEVIHYYIVKDTLVYVPQFSQTLQTTIDTLWITGIVGLPAGFSYSCHNSECKILGGTTGCATIYGTPNSSAAGIYPLLVLIRIRATAKLGRIPIGQTVNDTNARYSLVVNGTTGNPMIYHEDEVLIFPNPANQEIQVKLPENSGAGSYEITDLNGKLRLTNDLNAGHKVIKIDIQNLSAGIYFFRMMTRDGVMTRKFTVIE